MATTSWPWRNVRGVAELDRGQAVTVDAEQRKVGVGVGADLLGLCDSTVGQQDFDGSRAGDDVIIGQHIAVGGDDDAGAGAFEAVSGAAIA